MITNITDRNEIDTITIIDRPVESVEEPMVEKAVVNSGNEVVVVATGEPIVVLDVVVLDVVVVGTGLHP